MGGWVGVGGWWVGVCKQGADEWHAAKLDLAEHLGHLDGKVAELDSAIHVCKDMVALQKSSAKREKQNVRYKLFKHTKRFQSSGAALPLARMGSELTWYADQAEELPEHFLRVDASMKDIKLDAPFLATLSEEFPLRAVFLAMAAKYEEKEQQVQAKLTNQENSALRGLYVQTASSTVQDEVAKLKDDWQCQDLGGDFAPFVVGNRKWTMRVGPQAMPLPGVGCFIHSPRQHMMAVLLPIRTLMQTGGLVHLDHIAATLEKKELKDGTFPMAIIKPDEILWAPYGYVCITTGPRELNVCRVTPWMSEKLRDAVDEDVFELISVWNLGFARKNKDRAPWKEIFTTLEGFFRKADKS